MQADAGNQDCILCLKEIGEKTQPEHILLNALGGRMTVRRIICPQCNGKMGKGPDADLARSTAFLRNICQLEAGDGGTPPQLQGMESKGERFDLKPGMQPSIRSANPLDVQITEREISVRIEAYSDEEAEKLAEGAAAKIAKQLGRKDPIVIQAIKQEILKGRKSSFRPAPAVHHQMQFGAGRSKQAMAKACLVLWAKEVGNAEVCSERYNEIRQYINSSENEECADDLIKIDTRAISEISGEFGTHPNFIVSSSDENGNVYGYYRIFGAIGWRFRLCRFGAPSTRQVSLVSNPFNPKNWQSSSTEDIPVRRDWIFAEWDAWPPHFEAVQSKISEMAAYAANRSKDEWLTQLVEEGRAKAGCREGEQITEEHFGAFAAYVSRAIASQLLKKEIPED